MSKIKPHRIRNLVKAPVYEDCDCCGDSTLLTELTEDYRLYGAFAHVCETCKIFGKRLEWFLDRIEVEKTLPYNE